jgi:hypothetical protein
MNIKSAMVDPTYLQGVSGSCGSLGSMPSLGSPSRRKTNKMLLEHPNSGPVRSFKAAGNGPNRGKDART